LFTMNFVWAENLPSPTSIQVQVLSTYSHRANDGTTVVLGEVQNNENSPINDVTLGVTFMDDNSNQIEYKTGTTLLQVIPPGGKVPFAISSTKADLTITQTQVKIAGFRSAADRTISLVVTPDLLQVSDKLIISGTITNNGAQKSTNTKLYLISYDPFQRVVAVGISNPIDVDTGKDSQFSIISDSSSRAQSYAIIAESDNYQSKITPANSVQVTLPVVVSNTMITDPNGTSYSTIPVNAVVKISSTTKYLLNSTQSFIYYVQVKQFDGKTDFIGKYEGVFLGAGDQNVSTSWTPHMAGSYFVETYVWNYDAVPLSAAAPSINVVLVK
ncbi:MAG: FxLYD domain-containing protein, partial [Thaumarchaeota archaeon]|nr:FxLYD domain-containing protein [Nitrososphaerota archaeon]